MAINPRYGRLVEAAQSDPNGPPGRTSGGVPGNQASTPPETRDPTAGSTESVPPFLPSPRRDPILDAFDPVAEVGPDT